MNLKFKECYCNNPEVKSLIEAILEENFVSLQEGIVQMDLEFNNNAVVSGKNGVPVINIVRRDIHAQPLKYKQKDGSIQSTDPLDYDQYRICIDQWGIVFGGEDGKELILVEEKEGAQ